ALTDRGRPPFLRKPAAVLAEQLPGVDAVPRERSAAEMVDEQVVRNCKLKSSPPGSLGQVIVIEEPQAESLIEPADRLINSALHEQAEPRQLSRREPLPAVLV